MNIMQLQFLSNSKSETGWALPTNINQYQTGFPAWLSVWGFVDFIKKIKIHIKPPPTMKKQWYFQHDLANTPLLMTQIAATSFDQYYISQGAESTNITINTCLLGAISFYKVIV